MARDLGDRITPSPEVNLPVVAGQLIGERYLIGSVIGEGGMGVVCAATHVGLGTPVAVKLIRSDLKHDEESVLRFLNEARTAASLKGEHIARVYDVGQLESGEPYLVMEQLEGMPLDAYIEESAPLDVTEAVDIVLQACEGLAEAHAVALVHRDIKAANLFLARRPDGQFVLKILDFGISKRLIQGTRSGLTDPGKSMGSPWYMSPEQMMNAASVDQRADVWSLGVLLYELLTDEYPFNGEGVVQVCANVLTLSAPAPSALRPEVDARLDAIVLRCLEKSPAARYPSVTALAEALRPFGSRPVQAPTLLAADTLSLDEDTRAPKRMWEDSVAPKRARETATPESLAPVAAHPVSPLPPAPDPSSKRSGWSTLATVFVSIALGVALSWFAWPYVRDRYGATDWSTIQSQLSRARLPGDPVLAPGPFDEPLLADREWQPAEPVLNRLQSAAVTLPQAPATVPSSASASQPLELDPEEIRRRTARYEAWLREHGLTRLNQQEASDTEPAPRAQSGVEEPYHAEE